MELRGLGVKELCRRAKAAGMPASELEEGMDSDEPKERFIRFLLQQQEVQATKAESSETAFRRELDALKLKELRQRAKAAGMCADELDTIMDAV
eukprot:COSAG02_NODE_38458_length_428_cov_3.334347_1_plen_93_part_01